MSWIQTANGHLFDVLAPDPAKIDITDIAHALSNICRYTGHTGVFYSVAQNSVLASLHITDAKFALAALMHDASEAYLGDVSRPLKKVLGKTYTDIEDRLEAVIARKYGYEYPYPDCVKEIDNALLETEFKHVMGGKQFDLDLGRMLDIPMRPWAPDRAERNFLERFDQLYGQPEFDFGLLSPRRLKAEPKL